MEKPTWPDESSLPRSQQADGQPVKWEPSTGRPASFPRVTSNVVHSRWWRKHSLGQEVTSPGTPGNAATFEEATLESKGGLLPCRSELVALPGWFKFKDLASSNAVTSSKYVSDCFTRGIYELQHTKPLSHWDFSFNFTHKQYKRCTFFSFSALNQFRIIIICPERKAPTKRIHNQHKQIQCYRFICDFRQFFVFVFYIFSPNCGLDVQSALM